MKIREIPSGFYEEFKLNNYTHFSEFYRLTSRPVYFTALGILKEPSAAEEIVQDTYVAFLETVERFRVGENVYAYLSTIARNKALNYLEKNKRLVFDEDAIAAVSCEPELDYGGVEEILGLLDNAEEREIVVYHVLLEYKFREIAKIIDKPLGTVLWRYNKAMKALRERVKL